VTNDQAPDVQHQMEEVRSHLKQSIEGVVEHMEALTDWKAVVQRHPWACLSAAAVLGYLAVPRRRPEVCTDVETLAKLVERCQPAGAAKAPQLTPGGIAISLASMVGNSLLRAGALYAIDQIGQWCRRQPEPDETSLQPAANGSPTTSCQAQ
jgi:hypothetical protein